MTNLQAWQSPIIKKKPLCLFFLALCPQNMSPPKIIWRNIADVNLLRTSGRNIPTAGSLLHNLRKDWIFNCVNCFVPFSWFSHFALTKGVPVPPSHPSFLLWTVVMQINYLEAQVLWFFFKYLYVINLLQSTNCIQLVIKKSILLKFTWRVPSLYLLIKPAQEISFRGTMLEHFKTRVYFPLNIS